MILNIFTGCNEYMRFESGSGIDLAKLRHFSSAIVNFKIHENFKHLGGALVN